jgi:DNA-binding cell septation regulator SpoVG
MPDANSNLRITVTLRAASKPGSIKAHADIVIDSGSSKIEVSGLSVIKHDPEKPAWVSYPQRPAKDGKKYFPIVRVTGALHEKISVAILHEWERTSTPAKDHGDVRRAQIPREPGDEILF